jgi:hypothetical protein
MLFALVGKEGGLWDAKDMHAKYLLELLWHLAVVPHVVIKFGTAWRGGAVVDCSGNCHGGEGLGAKDVLMEEVIILITNDVTNATRDNGSDGLVFQCPSLGGEGVNVSGSGGLPVVVTF